MKTVVYKFLSVALSICIPFMASASHFDEILDSGQLRCMVVSDFPPMGFRNEKNEVVGFDVDYCKNLATALGVKLQLVTGTFPSRIPTLLSNKADVILGVPSDTLERQRTISFSIPYFAQRYASLKHKGVKLESWDDLRHLRIGVVVGTTYESNLKEYAEKHWTGTKLNISAYQSESEMYLAVEQGHVDVITVSEQTIPMIISSGKYKNIEKGILTPYAHDYASIMVRHGDQDLLNFLNLFINRFYRSGDYSVLFHKWNGSVDVVPLASEGVYR